MATSLVSYLQSISFKTTAYVCGALFLGYCVYFDKKRRSDPQFKSKLREKRARSKLEKQKANAIILPDLKNPEAIQEFLVSEINKGEEMIACKEIESGVEHFATALALSGAQQPYLLQILRQTLDPVIFSMILAKIPEVQKRILTNVSDPSMFKMMDGSDMDMPTQSKDKMLHKIVEDCDFE